MTDGMADQTVSNEAAYTLDVPEPLAFCASDSVAQPFNISSMIASIIKTKVFLRRFFMAPPLCPCVCVPLLGYKIWPVNPDQPLTAVFAWS
jgi:hypothetical protein